MYLNTISWKAIFAGSFISLLVYLVLASLGLALGGSSLGTIIEGGTNAGGLGIGTAVWLVFSALVALFFGAFASSRASGDILKVHGAIQGLVIASIFYLFLLGQVGGLLGALGRGVGGTVGLMGSAVGNMADNPEIRDTLENAISDQTTLKSPPGDVARGLASRLLRGDSTGARDYLAAQTGMSPENAQIRIDQIQRDLSNKLKGIGATTARVISVAGWSLFGLLLLGSIFAVLGGRAGAGYVPAAARAVEKPRRAA